MDGAVERAYGFRWPANLCPDDSLLGKLERFYHKKYRFTPRIQETRNVLERGTHASKVLLAVGDGGAVTSVLRDEESHIRGVWEFRDRHLITMIAYVQAGAPEFDQLGLTQALDYHEWVLRKLTAPRQHTSLPALVEADFRMRTAWMLSYVSGEHERLKGAVEYHRGHSAYLFADVHRTGEHGQGSQPATPAGKEPKRALPWQPETPRKEARKSGGKSDGRGTATRTPAGKGGTESFLEHHSKAGRERCKWYNKGKCNKGATCTFEHVCNFPGCGQKHPRVEHHPVRPE